MRRRSGGARTARSVFSGGGARCSALLTYFATLIVSREKACVCRSFTRRRPFNPAPPSPPPLPRFSPFPVRKATRRPPPYSLMCYHGYFYRNVATETPAQRADRLHTRCKPSCSNSTTARTARLWHNHILYTRYLYHLLQIFRDGCIRNLPKTRFPLHNSVLMEYLMY